MLNSKVVKIDSKIIISSDESKSVTHSVGEEKCYDFVPLTSHIVYLFVYIQLYLYLEVNLVESFSHCSFSSNILSSSHTLCSLMAYDNKIYWTITKPCFLTHEVKTKSSAYLLGNSTRLAEPDCQRGGYGARSNPAFLKSVEWKKIFC